MLSPARKKMPREWSSVHLLGTLKEGKRGGRRRKREGKEGGIRALN